VELRIIKFSRIIEGYKCGVASGLVTNCGSTPLPGTPFIAYKPVRTPSSSQAIAKAVGTPMRAAVSVTCKSVVPPSRGF
jgi:hypothetical protein